MTGDDGFLDLVEALRARVAAELSAGPAPNGTDRPARVRAAVKAALDEHARQRLATGRVPLDPPVEQKVARAVTDAFLGLAGLQPLLDDPDIENININGADAVWVRYADGRKARLAPVAASDDDLVALIRTIAARAGAEERRFDRGVPRLSVQLPNGARLFAVQAVTKRVCVSIRQHRLLQVSLAELVDRGTLPAGLGGLLTAMVRARHNLVVSGGTGKGKTTFARALAQAIPPDERIITIEDAYELALDDDPAHPDAFAMQAREANIEGHGAIDLDELVRWALRKSPDRVIVGEVRGREALAMAMAMSQGNDGSIATVHASTSRQALTRLATYATLAPEGLTFDTANLIIAGAVHFVIHLDQTGDGTRVVSSVREVLHADGGDIVSNEIFRPGPDKRAIPAAPMRTESLDRLSAAGFDPDTIGRW